MSITFALFPDRGTIQLWLDSEKREIEEMPPFEYAWIPGRVVAIDDCFAQCTGECEYATMSVDDMECKLWNQPCKPKLIESILDLFGY
jgi:hypothetical protein